MRLNLSFKFFLAFVATSFTIVVLMVAAMQFYARRNFTEYICKVEALRLAELSLILQDEYRSSNGWKRLRSNPEQWHKLLRPRGSAAYTETPPPPPPGFESSRQSPPLHPPPRDRRKEGPRDGRRGLPESEALREVPDRSNQPEQDFERRGGDRGRRPAPPAFGIEHRLSLFDDQKELVMGRAETTEGSTLQEIGVDGKTVGWLALREEPNPSDPLDMAFLKQQAQAFYVVGALMLGLAALMAFLLSRHLLAPVQQLIRGTRSLTSRRFETRIRVSSSDELGQLAGDFNQMAQTLQNYEQMRQQWISDIAHELRTPLSILRGEIEALQDGIRQASPARLESLHAEVVHMSTMVGNLHDLSLAESAALHILKEPVNLVAALRGCLRKFQSRFSERGIAVTDELGPAESITITGDAGRLTQVFSNLLENTLRYTDSPGSLVVRQLCTTADVLLQFSDTKPGVPAESLPRLFDRLYRVDASRSRELGGSGLGLSICKAIIEAHGGEIAARLSPAGGLQIDIKLPLQQKKPARKDTGRDGA